MSVFGLQQACALHHIHSRAHDFSFVASMPSLWQCCMWQLRRWCFTLLYQEVVCGLELTKFSAVPSMMPEKTLPGHVAPLHSVMASWKLPHCHFSKLSTPEG
jgi:hypothetical protein